MLATTLPAYLYQQYNSDPDLEAFFTAYNNTSQEYLNTINALNLPVYTSASITGVLLDWVGNSLYGIARPYITTGSSSISKGVYDTTIYDTIDYNTGIITSSQIPIASMFWSLGIVTVTVGATYNLSGISSGNIQGVTPAGYNGDFALTSIGPHSFTYALASNPGAVTTQGFITNAVELASDDIYKRVITWNFYRGDGYQFNINWLKRRVVRFLSGINGSDPYQTNIDGVNAYQISIIFPTPSSYNATIQILSGAMDTSLAATLQSFVSSQVLQLPFQYNWAVTY